MGVQAGPTIVRDSSLILELDAADKNSYIGSGTNFVDLSSNLYSTTLTNGAVFSSSNNGVISFDGSNDYIDTNQNFNFDNQSFSLNVWFKSNAATGTTRHLIWKQETTSSSPNFANLLRISLNWGNRGDIMFYWTNSSRTLYGFISPTGFTYNDNIWHLVSFNYDNSTNSVFGYIDTILQLTGTTTGTLLTSSNSIKIGSGTPKEGTNVWLGSLGPIYFYNRKLTQTEVLNNYNAQKSRFGL